MKYFYGTLFIVSEHISKRQKLFDENESKLEKLAEKCGHEDGQFSDVNIEDRFAESRGKVLYPKDHLIFLIVDR